MRNYMAPSELASGFALAGRLIYGTSRDHARCNQINALTTSVVQHDSSPVPHNERTNVLRSETKWKACPIAPSPRERRWNTPSEFRRIVARQSRWLPGSTG